jgi:O-antigen ligase
MNNKNFINTDNSFYNTISLSIILSLNILAVIFSSLNIISSGFTFFAVIFSLLISLFPSFIKKSFSINKVVIALVAYIFLLFLFSYLRLNFHQMTTEYFLNFILLGLISMFLGSKKINTEMLLRIMSYLSFLLFFFISSIFNEYSLESSYISIEMGISYAILPISIGTFLHMFYYFKFSNLIIKLSYLFNFYYLFLLIAYGTRGGILAIFVLFIFMFSLKINRGSLSGSLTKFLIVVILSLLTFLFVVPLLEITYSLLEYINIELSFVEKSIILLKNEGNILNLRASLYSIAWSGFLDSPIFGQGIGSFNLNTGQLYVHNILLDLLYETGLMLSVPIFLIIIKSTHILFFPNKISLNYYIFLLFLYSISIPRLALSASLWSVQSVWILISSIIIGLKNN